MQTVLTSLKNQALIDYYRCPEGIGDFVLAGQLCEDSGFFRFGADAICYGQFSSGVSAKAVIPQLHDSFQDISTEGSTLRLPFDPSQVVNNLRCERYAGNSLSATHKSFQESVIQGIYYAVRPMLPVQIRRHIQ